MKSWLIQVLIIIFLLSFVSCRNGLDSENNAYEKGVELFDNNKFSKSKKYFIDSIDYNTIVDNKERILLAKLYIEFINIEKAPSVESIININKIKEELFKYYLPSEKMKLLISIYLIKDDLYLGKYELASNELKDLEQVLASITENDLLEYERYINYYVLFCGYLDFIDAEGNDFFSNLKFKNSGIDKNILLFIQLIKTGNMKDAFKIARKSSEFKKDLLSYMLIPVFQGNLLSYKEKERYLNKILKYGKYDENHVLYYYLLYYQSELEYKERFSGDKKVKLKDLSELEDIYFRIIKFPEIDNSEIVKVCNNRIDFLDHEIATIKEAKLRRRKVLLEYAAILVAMILFLKLVAKIVNILRDKKYYRKVKKSIQKYGDGFIESELASFDMKMKTLQEQIKANNRKSKKLDTEYQDIENKFSSFFGFNKDDLNEIESEIEFLNEKNEEISGKMEELESEKEEFITVVNRIKVELSVIQRQKNIVDKSKRKQLLELQLAEVEKKQYYSDIINILDRIDQHILRLKDAIDENIINISLQDFTAIKDIVSRFSFDETENIKRRLSSHKSRFKMIRNSMSIKKYSSYTKEDLSYYKKRYVEIIQEINMILKSV